MQNLENKQRMEKWSVQSPKTEGFHKVITPETCECQEAQMFRLNLSKGSSYTLQSGNLEMHPVLLKGKAKLSGHKGGKLGQEMEKLDSCYLPGDDEVTITAQEDCIFYIAGAKYEGIGEPHFRKFDPTLPIGDVHQIHGEGAGRREVMFTLAPQDSPPG